jgi:hypothetical protein
VKKSEGRIADIEACRKGLMEIIEEMQPMTVRQVFYQAVVRGLFHKTEYGYNRVQTDTGVMRRSGELPYEWLEDNTRAEMRPTTYNSPEDALDAMARSYRKSLWTEADSAVQIWLEKDALSSIVSDVTWEYDVSLMVARGFSSLSFLHTAAQQLNEIDVPAYIYHLGDYDPSGVAAGESIEATLREMAPATDITFTRIAVNKEQIRRWHLPTRPTKKTDSRAASFGDDESVELDAIAPNRLRGIVRAAIEQHLPPDQFQKLKAKEAREQRAIIRLVKSLRHASDPEEASDDDRS